VRQYCRRGEVVRVCPKEAVAVTGPAGRDDLTRRIIDFGLDPDDLGPRLHGSAAAVARAALPLDWPSGLEPTPQPLDHEPDPSDPLPRASCLVVTWTKEELRALADVLTPGVNPSTRWYRYDRDFERYLPSIRKGAPARVVNRLGSYHPTKIGNRSVLCFKSELHLNQDAVRLPNGRPSLPVADLFRQLIAEVQPSLVITTGTAGGTMRAHALGDVVITRGARFRLARELGGEPYARRGYKSATKVPTKHLAKAEQLMRSLAANLAEPEFGPPTLRYEWDGPLVPGVQNEPSIHVDGRDLKAFHPILSTDWFEFGTTTNGLDRRGCGVEMGDAVLGMVAKELGAAAPGWLVVRNLSNPPINGDLPTEPVDMQAHWSEFFYKTYGYWTSVNGAIATWAVIAG
jgi:hypothetical protein